MRPSSNRDVLDSRADGDADLPHAQRCLPRGLERTDHIHGDRSECGGVLVGSNNEIQSHPTRRFPAIFEFLIGVGIPVRRLQARMTDPLPLQISGRTILPQQSHARMPKRVQPGLGNPEFGQQRVEYPVPDTAR